MYVQVDKWKEATKDKGGIRISAWQLAKCKWFNIQPAIANPVKKGIKKYENSKLLANCKENNTKRRAER